jgi:hypothetical protein
MIKLPAGCRVVRDDGTKPIRGERSERRKGVETLTKAKGGRRHTPGQSLTLAVHADDRGQP